MLPLTLSALRLNSSSDVPLPPMKASQSPWRGPTSAV
jgi:hypothetical protein